MMLQEENEKLRKALGSIYDCAQGIMPIYKNDEDLRQKIIGLQDAKWTRLFAIYAEAKAALGKE